MITVRLNPDKKTIFIKPPGPIYIVLSIEESKALWSELGEVLAELISEDTAIPP